MEGRFVTNPDDDSGGHVGDFVDLEFSEEGLAEPSVEPHLVAAETISDIMWTFHSLIMSDASVLVPTRIG